MLLSSSTWAVLSLSYKRLSRSSFRFMLSMSTVDMSLQRKVLDVSQGSYPFSFLF